MDSNALVGWLTILSVPVGILVLFGWYTAHTWSQEGDRLKLPSAPVAERAKIATTVAFVARISLVVVAALVGERRDVAWLSWVTWALTIVFIASVITWLMAEKKRREA